MRKYNGKQEFFNHHMDKFGKVNKKPQFFFQEKDKEPPIRVSDFTTYYPATIQGHPWQNGII